MHLRMHKNSAIKVLTSRLNALWKVSKFASFRTRKMVQDGKVTSSLIYMIQLWGGCNQSLLSCLQMIQNKLARAVTGLGLRTSVQTLLDQCGWRSVCQLVVYHRCLSVFKTCFFQKPEYFCKMFSRSSNGEEEPISFRTRLHSTGGVRMDSFRVKNCLEQQSFYFDSLKSWNSLPAEIRQSRTLVEFKKKLKNWITMNIPIR